MKRINSIDIYRIIAAIMVIAIHTNPFIDSNYCIYYLVVQILTRTAVPFFFCISGIGFFNALNTNDFLRARKQLFSVIRLYSIWTIVYYCIAFPKYLSDGINFKGIIYAFTIDYFINGSKYHFWYLVCMIYVMLIVYGAYKLHIQKLLLPVSIVFFIICTIGCAYYNIGIEIPLLKNLYLFLHFNEFRRLFGLAFPFFVLGSIVEKTGKFLSLKRMIFICFIYLVEIIVVNTLDLNENIFITFSLYGLVICLIAYLINHPMDEYSNFARSCKDASIWVYCIHPLFIDIIRNYISRTEIVFFLVIIISIISWFIKIEIQRCLLHN